MYLFKDEWTSFFCNFFFDGFDSSWMSPFAPFADHTLAHPESLNGLRKSGQCTFLLDARMFIT